MTNTVRKNSKEFAAAFGSARSFKIFSLENGFTGVDVSEFPRWVDKQDLALVRNGAGYIARVHSNFWVEFEVAA